MKLSSSKVKGELVEAPMSLDSTPGDSAREPLEETPLRRFLGFSETSRTFRSEPTCSYLSRNFRIKKRRWKQMSYKTKGKKELKFYALTVHF